VSQSHTERDPRLFGATNAIHWPRIAGDPVEALLVCSPATGDVLLANLAKRLPYSRGLSLGNMGPRIVVSNYAREDGWVLCDTGWLVRFTAQDTGTALVLAETARAQISRPGFANWGIYCYSRPTTDRRIASGWDISTVRLASSKSRTPRTRRVGG
jgi:hypothetical protein